MRGRTRYTWAVGAMLGVGSVVLSVSVAAAGPAPSSQVAPVVMPATAAQGTAAAVPRRAPCGTNGLDLDTRTGRATEDVRIRNGTSVECRVVGGAEQGDPLDYYCFTRGGDHYYGDDGDHTWTFLRDLRTQTLGWVRDDNLPRNDDGGRGSPVPCRT